MTPSEIGQSYDALADDWNSHVFSRHDGIAQHQRALAFVTEKRRALDVGSGSSGRFVQLLLDEGFDVEGVDVSLRMITLARQRHPTVTFHHADICDWEPRGQYDLISAWDSIWHVPLLQLERVLTKLLAALAPGGVSIFTMGGTDGPGEKIDSEMGPPMYYSSLGIPNMLQLITSAGCVVRHMEYDKYPELHLYAIAQRL